MNNTPTTQPSSQNLPTNFPQNPSLIIQNPPSSVPIPQNLFNSQPLTSIPPSTSYNPYVSLHPGFQNYPTNSFQPPNFPLNPFPPSTSALPFNPPSSYPPPLLQMTPSVPIAVLSDPIKLFDGLDQTYPPEKFLAHLSARDTIQLGPQPIDFHSYLTWHSRRMSLLYCSVTETASNWYDRHPQVYKDDWSSFLLIFKKQFYSQKQAYHAQIEALFPCQKG